MAGAVKLETGTRLQLAFEPEPGKQANFDMMSTFNKALDESAFLVSIPMREGKSVDIDDTQKILFRYEMGGEEMLIAGYVDDIVKVGVRRYWKVRRVSEQRQFLQRTDERVKVVLKIDYMQPTWPLNYDGKIDKEEAMSMDISAGGAALFINRRFDVGEIVHITLPRVGISAEGKAIEDMPGQVCWYREAPKGSVYRNICGLQFQYGDQVEKERVQKYIGAVKSIFKL